MGLKKLFGKWFGKDEGPAKAGGRADRAEGGAGAEPLPLKEEKLFPCPVCGSLTIEEPRQYEICPVCGWEDDPVQRRDPDMTGGANKMSLNQAKDAYAKGEKVQ